MKLTKTVKVNVFEIGSPDCFELIASRDVMQAFSCYIKKYALPKALQIRELSVSEWEYEVVTLDGGHGKTISVSDFIKKELKTTSLPFYIGITGDY